MCFREAPWTTHHLPQSKRQASRIWLVLTLWNFPSIGRSKSSGRRLLISRNSSTTQLQRGGNSLLLSRSRAPRADSTRRRPSLSSHQPRFDPSKASVAISSPRHIAARAGFVAVARAARSMLNTSPSHRVIWASRVQGCYLNPARLGPPSVSPYGRPAPVCPRFDSLPARCLSGGFNCGGPNDHHRRPT